MKTITELKNEALLQAFTRVLNQENAELVFGLGVTKYGQLKIMFPTEVSKDVIKSALRNTLQQLEKSDIINLTDQL